VTAPAEKHCILTISCLDARNIENVVLTRSVRYQVEHRFLLNGTKTVVSRSPQPGCTE
jgi:formyltetrahydrofolate hydrolase